MCSYSLLSGLRKLCASLLVICFYTYIVTSSVESVIEVLWPVIRKQLVGGIFTRNRPELKCLRKKKETFSEWLSISAEEILLRWVNHVVNVDAEAGEEVAVPNFSLNKVIILI